LISTQTAKKADRKINMDDEAYKKAKEAFVSGNDGTTVTEIALILSILSVCIYLYLYPCESYFFLFIGILFIVAIF